MLLYMDLFDFVRIVISLSLHIFIPYNSCTDYLSNETYHKTVTCNRLYNTIPTISNHQRLPFNSFLINIYNTKMDLSNVSILITNIRSSYKNLDNFKNYINSITVKWAFFKPTETWGKRNTVEQQIIPDYNHV